MYCYHRIISGNSLLYLILLLACLNLVSFFSLCNLFDVAGITNSWSGSIMGNLHSYAFW